MLSYGGVVWVQKILSGRQGGSDMVTCLHMKRAIAATYHNVPCALAMSAPPFSLSYNDYLARAHTHHPFLGIAGIGGVVSEI